MASPPVIFSPSRRLAARRRMLDCQARGDAARYLLDDMVEDVIERLAFLRHAPREALVIGDVHGVLVDALTRQGVAVRAGEPARGFDEEAPAPGAGFGLVVSLGTLDTVNDLPGALILARRALGPGGLMLASFPGAGSLPQLRAAMLAADDARPAPRLDPMIDVRAGGQLLQRAGFADPLADSRGLDVAYRSLGALVADLRAQGLGNVLAEPGPRLDRSMRARAAAAFAAAADDGRTIEHFELLTLSGWAR